MFRQTKKFLLAIQDCLVALCIAEIVRLGNVMEEKSQKAISQVGTIYMSELNRQLQQKFVAIVNLQMTQLEGIVERTPPETVDYGEDMLYELSLSGSVRKFSYLALYNSDGECEPIIGDSVKLYDED